MLLRNALVLKLLAAVYAAPQVKLGHTTVIGSNQSRSNVQFFGGIPFAAPPVGNLRLANPVLVTSFPKNSTIFEASSSGPGCLQTALPASMVSEDCLTLDIFRPAGVADDARLPVMYWIYGGAFLSGGTASSNGSGIVERSINRGTPVIFVTANYRVGPLGFPQGIEAGSRGAVNLGLKDQLAGLEWVQENIGAFGGDKTKVTVFGGSAGAQSISIHLLGTPITRLSRAAILESNVAGPNFGPGHRESAWQNFVAAVPECASVAVTSHTFECLQRADSNSLLKALSSPSISGAPSFLPVIDGPGGLLPDVPSRLKLKNRFPVILGTNLDEGTIFTPQAINSTEQIREALINQVTPSLQGAEALSAAVDQILELYPDDPVLGSPFGTGNNTFGLSSQYKRYAAIFGDFTFQSSRRAVAQSLNSAGVKVFSYLFSDPDGVVPPGLAPIIPPAPGSLGVTHGTELFFVFNTLGNPTLTAIALSGIMQDYWISFATSLDPNDEHGSIRPKWDQYKSENPRIMQLNGHNTTQIPDIFQSNQMKFFNANNLVFNR